MKRRLAAVEQDLQPNVDEFAASFRRMQAELCCPLPDESSADEIAQAESMLVDAQRALREHGDDGPLLMFREFAKSLHRKYDTTLDH